MTTATMIAQRYRLLSELGRGGMGVVWLAFDDLLHREVAIKQVHFPSGLSVPERNRLAARTLREARAVAAVETPAAVRVFDIVEQDAQPWIVMELVRGQTLTALVRERTRLPAADVARIGLALAGALEVAHRAGVLHRDVKPSNVLVGDDGRVALSDFGVASLEGDADTTSGVILGSPSYLAPERLHSQPATAASDLWSLGATLWTAAEGEPPYRGDSPVAIMAAVATTDPPAPVRGDPALAALLRAMMARDPSRRPDAAGVIAQLRRLQVSLPAEAAVVDSSPAPELLPAAFDRTAVLPAAALTTWLPTVRDGQRLDGAASPPATALAAAALAAAPPPATPPAATPPAATRPAATRPAATPPPATPPPAAVRTTAPNRRGRRRAAAWAAAALVLALVAGVATALLGSHSSGRNRAVTTAAPPSVPAPTRPPSSPAPTPSGSAAAPTAAATAPAAGAAVPAGFRRYTDPQLGWSVSVPAAWVTGSTPAGTTFTDPAGGRYLLVATQYPAGPSALGAWLTEERTFEAEHADYARLRMATVQQPGFRDAAAWQFTYYQDGADLEALDLGLVRGQRGYALYFQTHVDRWAASQPLFQQMLASFQPAA